MLLNACSSLDNIEFMQKASAIVPGSTVLDNLTGSLGFDGFNSIGSSYQQTLSNEDIDPSKVDYVKIKSFSLEVTDPLGQDLSFFDSFEVHIQADGLDKVLIANLSSFPNGETKVNLEIPDINLKPYLSQDNMTITTEVDGQKPAEDTTIEASTVFDIDINVKNAIF